MRDVAIIGIGITQFGELWKSPLRDLHAEAVARSATTSRCVSPVFNP